MTVSTDVHVGSGSWYYCQACRWHGDSIELYASIKKVSVDNAVMEIHSMGRMTASDKITPYDITRYKETYSDNRSRLDTCWARLRDRLSETIPPDVMHLLLRSNLWLGSNNRSSRLFMSNLGGGLKHDVRRAFGGNHFLPQGFSAVLAWRLEDVPGRICGFQFLGKSVYTRWASLLGEDRAFEGGLLMLGTLPMPLGTIFAFDDPLLVLQLHRSRFCWSPDPAPVIGYNEFTRKTWSCLQAEKVILAPRTIDWRVFVNARATARSYIADAGKIYDSQITGTDKQELNRLEAAAVPWKEYFARWLVAQDNAGFILSQVQLNSTDRADMVELCRPEDKDKLLHCFSLASPTMRVQVGRSVVTERDGCWYSGKSALVSEELICDAPFVVERVSYDPRTKAKRLMGRIVRRGRIIEFDESFDAIDSDPAEWLRNTLLEAEAGLPIISSAWAPRLLDVAQQLHPPEQVALSRSLGVDRASLRFIFPSFLIEHGEFVRRRVFYSLDKMPGGSLQIPSGETPLASALPLLSEAQGAAAVLFSAVLANWLAPVFGVAVRPIGLIGAEGSLGQRMQRWLEEVLDLPVEEMDPANYERFQAKLNEFGWPSSLRFSSPSSFAYLPHCCADKLIALIPSEVGEALAVGGNWRLIRGGELGMAAGNLPDSADLLRYIADLQRRGFNTVGADPYKILEDLFAFRGSSGAESVAGRFLQDKTPGEALLDLCARLYVSGRLKAKHHPFYGQVSSGGPFPNASGDVWVDDEHAVILFSREGLLRALHKAHLPLPDLAPAIQGWADAHWLEPGTSAEKGWIFKESLLKKSFTRLGYGI